MRSRSGLLMRRVTTMLLVVASLAVGPLVTAPVAGADVPPALMTPNAPARSVSFTGGELRQIEFEGLAGQVVTITTSGGTFADDCSLRLQLRNPAGATRGDSLCAGIGATLGPLTLGADGLFRIDLTAGEAGGSVSVAVSSTPAKRSITPNASPFPVRIGAGGTVNLGFRAEAGQQIGVATDLADACATTVELISADGSRLGSPGCAGSLVGSVTVPATGVYRVRLRNTGTQTVTPQVEAFAAETPTLVVHAPETLTRTLASGASVEFAVAVQSGNYLTILSPNGFAISGGTTVFGVDGVGVVPTTLNPRLVSTVVDRTGLYRVRILNTGGTTMDSVGISVITGVHPQQLGSIDGPAVAFTVRPAERFSLNFAGTVGQSVHVQYAARAFRCVALERPDGSMVRRDCSFVAAFQIVDTKLDVSGVWRVVFESFSEFELSSSIQVLSAPDPTVLAIGGQSKTLVFSGPGETSYREFSATAGQHLVISVSSAFYFCFLGLDCRCPGSPSPDSPQCPTVVELVDPTGAVAPGNSVVTTRWRDSPAILRATASRTGQWRVRAVGAMAGIISVSVVDAPDLTAAVRLDTPVDVIASQALQRVVLAFPVESGHRYGLVDLGAAESNGVHEPDVEFLQPNGTRAVQGVLTNEAGFVGPMMATSTGTAKVVLMQTAPDLLSERVKIVEVDDLAPLVNSVTLGTVSKVVSTGPSQVARFTFTGAVGDRISALVSSFAYPRPVRMRIKFGERLLLETTVSASSAFVDPIRLDAAGSWTVEFDAPRADTGGLAVLLRRVVDVVQSIMVGGATKTFTLTTPGQRAVFVFNFAFNSSTGRRFQVVVTGATDSTMELRVLRSDGTVLDSCRSGVAASTGWFCSIVDPVSPGTFSVVVDPLGTKLLGATLRVRRV